MKGLWTKDTIYHPNTTIQVIMPQKEVHSPDHYTAIYSDLQDKDARLFLHSASASTAPASSWQRFFLTNDIRVIYHDIPAYLGTFHVGPCLPAIPPSTRDGGPINYHSAVYDLQEGWLLSIVKRGSWGAARFIKARLGIWTAFYMLVLWCSDWYHPAFDMEGSIAC